MNQTYKTRRRAMKKEKKKKKETLPSWPYSQFLGQILDSTTYDLSELRYASSTLPPKQ